MNTIFKKIKRNIVNLSTFQKYMIAAVLCAVAIVFVSAAIVQRHIADAKAEKASEKAEIEYALVSAIMDYENGIVPEIEGIIVSEYDRSQFEMQMLFYVGEPKALKNSEDIMVVSNWKFRDDEENDYYCCYKEIDAYTVIVAGMKMN